MPTPQKLERFRRRSAVYRGRVLRMLGRSRLKAPCAFMHLPKCGGTSLAEGLYALVPLDLQIGVLDAPAIRRAQSIYHVDRDDIRPYHDEGDHTAEVMALREQLVLMHMAHGCHLIHGHFLFSQKALRHFGETYKFVTLMRDPVARTVSNYRMALAAGVVTTDFDDFLHSPQGRRMALHNLRYFAGAADPQPDESPRLIELAKQNMAHFDVIGFIDRQPEFLDRFGAVFGARPSIGHHNRGTSEKISLSADQRRDLEALCAPDIELFEYARARP